MEVCYFNSVVREVINRRQHLSRDLKKETDSLGDSLEKRAFGVE